MAPDVVGYSEPRARQRLTEAGFSCRTINTAPPARLWARHRFGEELRVVQQRQGAGEVVLVVARPLAPPEDERQ